MATRDKKLELLALLEEKRRRDDVYRYKQFGEKLYPIQRELLQRTASHTQVCFMAANRVGKTMTGTYIPLSYNRWHFINITDKNSYYWWIQILNCQCSMDSNWFRYSSMALRCPTS